LFREALALGHILKYSHERVRSFQGIGSSKGPLLEIEPLGPEGLRYRSRIAGALTDGWDRLEAFKVTELKDAAGAGDWCTAGIIQRLGQRELGGFMQARRSHVEDALRFGQGLAAWNCGYKGARVGCTRWTRKPFDFRSRGSSHEMARRSQSERFQTQLFGRFSSGSVPGVRRLVTQTCHRGKPGLRSDGLLKISAFDPAN
jgi:hypothetical protein